MLKCRNIRTNKIEEFSMRGDVYEYLCNENQVQFQALNHKPGITRTITREDSESRIILPGAHIFIESDRDINGDSRIEAGDYEVEEISAIKEKE